MGFELKFKGTLGGALPAIQAVLSVGDLLVPIIGLLQPLIAFFEVLATLAKLALFIALLPLLAVAFLAKLLTDAIKAVFAGIADMIAAIANLDLSAAFSKYKFHGTVGHFGAACTDYFAAGIPEGAADPTKVVFGVFFIAVGTAGTSGLDQLFGPAPAMPPPTPPGAPPANTLNDVDKGGAQLVLGGGHVVGSWTNSRNVADSYRLEIHDGNDLPIPVGQVQDPGGTTAMVDVTHIDVKPPDPLASGISHSYHFLLPTDAPLVAGTSYKLVVSQLDGTGNVVAGSTKTSDPVAYTVADLPTKPVIPGPPADGALPVPASSEITLLERSAFHLAFPGLGGLVDFVKGLKAPLDAFEAIITQTIGRFTDEADAIEQMMQQWSDWVDGLHAQVTFLQDIVAQFGAFQVHFGGAFQVGEIWLYRYSGPVGEMGAAMSALLADGLPDGTGPAQVIECQFSLAEDPANQAILKFLTGG